MAKRKPASKSPAGKRHSTRRAATAPPAGMVYFGAQADPVTLKWYFIIYANEQRTRVKYRSEPLFETDEVAQVAAMAWIAGNPG